MTEIFKPILVLIMVAGLIGLIFYMGSFIQPKKSSETHMTAMQYNYNKNRADF